MFKSGEIRKRLFHIRFRLVEGGYLRRGKMEGTLRRLIHKLIKGNLCFLGENTYQGSGMLQLRQGRFMKELCIRI